MNLVCSAKAPTRSAASCMAIEEITKLVEESVTSEVFGVWFLIGAALVFFMQAGFAMVETGFTRAKNAGNIIMKNLMDFCIGTVVFVLLGFSLMMAEDYALGIFGVPNLDILTDFGAFLKGGNASSFVFNLVFCATAATIVSGSMAERTKFVSYCIYSGVISLFVYPIEAGWVWNSQGWLAQLGFHDFAGSAAIHSVGGITALIGAIMVGPRLGKYVKDKAGKVKKVNAIPGHSITLGALGCFILWFGWYGFNGAAAWDGNSLASIFVTTTIAPAVATCTTMLFTWIKNGKPDVSMCLNGSLAGLVGVTAGCDAVDALGSAIIGIVSGILVVVVVEVLDIKLHTSIYHMILQPLGSIAARVDGSCCQVVGLCCHAILQSLFSWSIRGSENSTEAICGGTFCFTPDHHEMRVCQSVVKLGDMLVICSKFVETKKAGRPT